MQYFTTKQVQHHQYLQLEQMSLKSTENYKKCDHSSYEKLEPQPKQSVPY